MTDLEVDPATATARIGAGVKGGTVLREAARLGLAPLVGSTPDVGAVGYLTSGGLPMLGRRYGFAADHVRALELVTADGLPRRTTADEHPDLFWAVRGGKGNFGVITSAEIGLVELSGSRRRPVLPRRGDQGRAGRLARMDCVAAGRDGLVVAGAAAFP